MAPVRFFDSGTPPHMVTMVIATAFGALGTNLFLPSLPAIAEHYSSPYFVVQLAVSIYLGANGVLQLIIGPLSDRFGRRTIMLAFILLALVATLGAIVAPTIYWFLLARALQGSAIAGLVLSRAIVRDMVSPDEAAGMIGYITMGMTVVPMTAPYVGGYLQEWFGWQASFVVMAGFGAVALSLVWADLGETNPRVAGGFRRQLQAYPDLFASRRFWGYCATSAFAAGVYFAYLGGGPYVASQYFGLQPSQYGFYFLFAGLGYIVGNFLSGRYAARVGINRMVHAGNAVTCLGMIISMSLLIAGFHHPLSVFAPISLLGVGNGLTMPSASAGIVSVRAHVAGAASGLGGALTIGGGACLSVLAGALLTPDSGPMPLIALMLAISVLAIVAGLYVAYIASISGELDPSAPIADHPTP